MRRLLLLRHAKSDWPNGVSDLERPLAERGRRDAPRMGRYLAGEMLIPDLVLVSPALRTRQTWELASAELAEKIPVRLEPRIYEAPPERLLLAIREQPDTIRTLMLVGHNPGSQALALMLTGFGDRYAASRMATKYPSAGLAVLDLPEGGWGELAPRACRLDRFITPAALGQGPDS
jgi:phosphohistidine phosphatase